MNDADYSSWTAVVSGLTPEQSAWIESAVTRRDVQARQVLIRQGEPRTHLYAVEQGSVRVFYTSAAGQEFTAKVGMPGTMVGIVAVLTARPPVYSVEALEKTRVLSLSPEALFNLMARIPKLSINLNRYLAFMYRAGLQRQARIIDSSAVRLGKVLCELAMARRAGHAPASVTITGVTQSDLATMVGVSRTWISLTLADFERQGLLQRRRGALVIDDLPSFVALMENPSLAPA